MTLNFSVIGDNWQLLAKGTGITIEVTFLALVLGVTLGLLGGLARLSNHKIPRYLSGAYVSVFRGTPLLVQLFIWYFGLPELGIQPTPMVAAVLGLALYSGSYQTEIVRGAIQSIEKGQMEAARSLGLSYFQAMRHVIIPQAFLRMLPPLGNEFVALTKNSSLVSLVTLQEVLLTADMIISRTFRALELYLAVAVIYYIITTIITTLTRYAERRIGVYL